MKQSKQIADRFREVFLNGHWVAQTNCKAQLIDLDWQQANTKIGSLNTIALLTFHLDYYLGGVLNVFNGGSLDIRDKYSFDMPAIESQADWEALRMRLWDNAEKFAMHVEQMPDEQLDEAFVEPQYGDYRRNIEAMTEHAYYHLGQISLIKKMILEGK